ncbi:MAG: ribosome biogenesis GTPase Der [Parcubacteria group bacterium]
MKMLNKKYPIVALVGRTNVGKSMLFNRLTEKKKALVSNIPGTTRDRRYGECAWQSETVTVTDTAGLDVESNAEIDIQSVKHAKAAIAEADLVVLVVDCRAGLLPQDKEFALMLKKMKKPVVLAVNKVESQRQMNQTAEFYKLGIKDVFAVSAKTGSGTGDFLDFVFQWLKDNKKFQAKSAESVFVREIRIALIGKPNTGKSSLLNRIVGEEKSIVSSVPHTTRDSQDVSVEYIPNESAESLPAGRQAFVNPQNPYLLTFTDTAGIIKKRKINDKLKKYSIEQSIESLKKSDIVLLMIDVSEPVTIQDKHLSREILENGKSLIFVVNKWDLLKDKTTSSDKEYIDFLHGHFPFLTWAPIIFVSAATGAKIQRLIETIIEIYENQHKLVTKKQMSDFLQRILRKQTPQPNKAGKHPYLHEIKQVGTDPLTFEIIAKRSESVTFPYRRYITRELRDTFGFKGCGIKLRLNEEE